MLPIPVIAIFDIGKTNKKFFLFSEQYEIVGEESIQFLEITDEDGFPCDDLQKLTEWIHHIIEKYIQSNKYCIKAINFSGYGASWVHIGDDGKPVAPLYNYLKPFPDDLKNQFYNNYGGEKNISLATASPVLGNLNSGMLLYYLRYKKPVIFDQIKFSLHLPQYLSYLVTEKYFSDITSIGCHTILWNFNQHNYHSWVARENILPKLAPIKSPDSVFSVAIQSNEIQAGIGIHDSSSALIPYLVHSKEPFVLISTGTWCISLHPFNQDPLTEDELDHDCMFYINYKGYPVKTSRLFAGMEHEKQVERLAKHFGLSKEYYKEISYNSSIINVMNEDAPIYDSSMQHSVFSFRKLDDFPDYETAYHQLMFDIIQEQQFSTSLVMKTKPVGKIFVDGGFAHNTVFMHFLANAFPDREVFAAEVSEASAIGAAMAIHKHWNAKLIPENMVKLKRYFSS